MIPATLRLLCTALALSFAFPTFAFAQGHPASSWDEGRSAAIKEQMVDIVTIAHPKNRHTCLMKAIDASEIVCIHRGHVTAYRTEEIAALIAPGMHTPWYLYFAAFLAASGAATWGTIALAPVCAPCAVVTGGAALFFLYVAPLTAMATDGDSPDELLYLAPGQTLKVKLRGQHLPSGSPANRK